MANTPIEAVASVVISATVEQVWETLTAESRLPDWFAGYPVLSYPEGTRRTNPTGQAFILSFPSVGRSREVPGEYVSFIPPDQLIMRFRDREQTSLVSYTLWSEGPHTTIVVSSETQYRSVALRLVGQILSPVHRSMMRSSLTRLKDLVEGGPNSPASLVKA